MDSQISDKDFREKSVGELYKQVKIPHETLIEISKQGDDKIEQFIQEKCKLSDDKDEEDKQKEKLKEIYKTIQDIFKNYIDMNEDYYPLIALWIIGTYFHDEFPSYPILFINAMRGSAKSRFEELAACLSKKGMHLKSISESSLFRAGKRTFCIDELEQIGSREKQTLREFLNSSYKRGGKVLRVKKVKEGKEEKQVVEEFDLYMPVMIANIYGIDEVLGDRCITLILERSNSPFFTKKAEDFENDFVVKKVKEEIKQHFSVVSGVVLNKHALDDKGVGVVSQKHILQDWNNYISTIYTTTHTTLTTLNNTNSTQTLLTPNKHTSIGNEGIMINANSLFEKIDKTNINGRNLELWFPLIQIASTIEEEDKIIEIAKRMTEIKSLDENVESKDVQIIKYIASQVFSNNFILLSSFVNEFRQFIGEDAENEWINTRSIGRALKRLNLVVQKKRINKGIEIILNYNKAIEKARMWT